jgi:hypothetical protein
VTDRSGQRVGVRVDAAPEVRVRHVKRPCGSGKPR